MPLHPVAWFQNVFKCTMTQTFLAGVKQKYDPQVFNSQNLQILLQSLGTSEISTTALHSPVETSEAATATALLSAVYSSKTPFVWVMLRKKDFLSSENFN